MKTTIAGGMFALVLAIGASAYAGEPTPIEKTIKQLQPTSQILSVKETPLKGLFEVTMKDFDPVYMSEDGRYFIGGQLMHMRDDGKVLNLTEEKLRAERRGWLQQVPEADQIVFGPKKPKAKVYVFTDVDCGYCRKFHTEVEDFTAMGVEVHYLAYPRGGTASEAFTKMQNVWCAKDRKAALTKVKAGGDIPAAACNSPVTKQYNLGQTVGVKGTPAVFLEDGSQIGGYLSPEQLKKALGI